MIPGKKFLLSWGIACLTAMTLLPSCMTYYQKTLQFQEYVTRGDFENAQKWLESDKKGKQPKNLMLHLLNSGWVNWITGQPEKSNLDLNTADQMMEDQQKNPGLEAVALMTNSTVKPYKPEDFEVVLVNYLKAINYLKLQQYEDALVECRKINIKLQQLNDKYGDKKNRYSSDAFAHLLMGLIYDASGDYNNAFIAYRNALEAYDQVFAPQFGVNAPLQLKKDLLRAAYRTGLREELRNYEAQFGFSYQDDSTQSGELIFLWHNGFGPVKAEWSLNFSKITKQDGFFTLADEEAGVTFPVSTATLTSKEESAFSDLHMVRIAFPKYVERKPFYEKAEIRLDNSSYPLEMVENVNQIAFKTLDDRMLREMSQSLLRLAVKQAMEQALKSSSDQDMKNLGAAVSLINAISEKADTRNWQTLPYEISYTRIPIAAGSDSLMLVTTNAEKSKEYPFSFDIPAGKTRFFVFSSLEGR